MLESVAMDGLDEDGEMMDLLAGGVTIAGVGRVTRGGRFTCDGPATGDNTWWGRFSCDGPATGDPTGWCWFILAGDAWITDTGED